MKRVSVRFRGCVTIAAVFASLLLFTTTGASAQQTPPWPERWFSAGNDFGSLRVDYRLTDDCEIDPDFEVVEWSRFEVTREEILASLNQFLEGNTRSDPPLDVLYRVFDDVLDPNRDPNQAMTEAELAEVLAALEELGPWPQVRVAPVSSTTYRCTFDPSGALVRVEQSAPGEDEFTDFDGQLSELGPFNVRWYIEE